jgi:hypothetical protein
MPKFNLPPKQFSFASFSFPKYAFTLPRGSVRQRIERMRNPVTGPYYGAPKPNSSGASFYLDSDFMPGLRYQYCDEIASIDHTGWFTDEHGDGDKIRGVVFRLPNNRGFLAGWTMGEGMASGLETDHVYDDERDAAYAADSIAENLAEKERAYQESQNEGEAE